MSKLAPIFVIIAAALWGVDGIVLRPELYTLPVPLVVFIESIIVALVLTPFFIKNFENSSYGSGSTVIGIADLKKAEFGEINISSILCRMLPTKT